MTTGNTEANFAVLAHKVDAIHTHMSDMQLAMRELTNAINKLALVEERQSNLAIAQERGFKVLERLEAKYDGLEVRVRELEVSEPEQKRTSTWVTAAVWGFVGLAASSIAHNFMGF